MEVLAFIGVLMFVLPVLILIWACALAAVKSLL